MTTVKILCACGTKFAFDADEDLMLAEGVIQCPSCGADAAQATNAQLLAARTAGTSPAPPPSAPVRLAFHKGNEVAAARSEAGSADTEDDAEDAADAPPAPVARPDFSRGRPLSKSEKQIRRNKELAQRRRPYVLLALLLLLGLGGFWGWYKVSGSKPKVLQDVTYSRAERPLMARLLNDGELLLVRNREISLHTVPGNDLLWQKSYGSITNFDDNQPVHIESSYRVDRPSPDIRVRSNSFWVVWPDHILHFEKESGAPHVDIRLHQEDLPRLLMGEHALFLGQKPTATNELAFEMFPYDGGTRQVLVVKHDGSDSFPEVVPDGLSLVTVNRRMLEEKMIVRKLATGPKVMTAAGVEKSVDQNVNKVLDENLTAGNSLGAAMQIVKEWQREDTTPDEIVEDHSRYEVTLTRRGRDGGSTWKGEVTGSPTYFPLPTVDVVAGERDFKVIAKNGTEKWGGTLTYPLSYRAEHSSRFHHPDFARRSNLDSIDDQHGLKYHFPFVEHGGRLYGYDRGVLAAYDLASGSVQWRLTSVGIRKIMFDHQDRLYVCTTTLSPQALNQSALEPEGGNDVLMKVDPTDGSVLWTQPYLGTDVFISDKFVYSQWVGENTLDAAAVMSAGGKGSSISCAITRIHPRSGEILWRLDYKGNPDTINIHGTTLLIQFARRLELADYFSF